MVAVGLKKVRTRGLVLFPFLHWIFNERNGTKKCFEKKSCSYNRC